MRPNNSYQHQGSINPITNTPLPYQQQARSSPYYQQQYPQGQSTAAQFAQQPTQSNGFNNTYYQQTFPQTINNLQQRSQATSKTIQVPMQQQVDAVELDHLNGFSGRYPDVIHMHPTDTNKIVYAVAGLVVIENINDKHEQFFLRGHDMDVSALAISRTGRFLASGQMGTKFAKVSESPVIIWDYQSRKPLQVFRGLRDGVTNVSFSDDEKFLAATSLSNQMTIWNCQDFTIVHNKVLEVPFGLIKLVKQIIVTWCPPRKSSARHSSYMLITSQGSNIVINILDFDVASMQYHLKQAPCQLPSTGLVRQYTKAVIDQTGDFLYVGTHAGEVCIFSISSAGGLFKAAIPISNNGVQNLKLYGKSLYLSNGDGKVKKLSGSDSRWQLVNEVQLEGRLTSLSIDSSGRELLVGSNFGKIYRLIAQNLDSTVHSEGHLQSIVGLSIPKFSNDIFVTIDMEGYILVWDLNDVLVITRCAPNSMNRVRGSSICLDEDKTVVSGWKDGFIRAFQITNKPISPVKWELANGHKGSVTSIYADKNYYLSGGEDGIVRVWSKSARQLLQQISIHSKEITKVFPDNLKANIIHSCSLDKTIHTYDLKSDKKVILHQAKNGMIMDMTQLKDREQEVVTCGINTPILMWDVDVVEAVDQIETGMKLNTIQISPDGKLLASGSDTGELVLISLTTNSVMGKYLGHSQGVSKVCWTCDQKQIITTGFDGSICIWNIYL